MSNFSHPNFPTSSGYMTDKIRQQYIQKAIAKKLLPENAHRMPQIISLDASNDIIQPIQIWQLYSVLGKDRIVRVVPSLARLMLRLSGAELVSKALRL